METKAVRFHQRKENYRKSLRLLVNQSKKDEISDENIGATLHFFEMTFELSWKVMKDCLEVNGIIAKSPREAIKMSFQQEYIADGALWLEMLDARNSIDHAYEEAVARKLFVLIREKYLTELIKIGDLACTD